MTLDLLDVEIKRERMGVNPVEMQRLPISKELMEKYQPAGVLMVSKGDKETQGKLMYQLIPSKPLEEVVRVYTEGAKKYAPRNWEKGIPWSECIGAMLRHVEKYRQGERRHERGMHHLGSVAFWCLALMEYERTHPELNDIGAQQEEGA